MTTKARRPTAAKLRNATGEQYISVRTRTLADGSTTDFYVLRLPQNVNPKRKEFHFAPCNPETLREAAERRDQMLAQLDADLADAKATFCTRSRSPKPARPISNNMMSSSSPPARTLPASFGRRSVRESVRCWRAP